MNTFNLYVTFKFNFIFICLIGDRKASIFTLRYLFLLRILVSIQFERQIL